MANEPDNLVLQLLRDIRGQLEGHAQLLAEHARLLGEQSKQIGEMQETALLAVGLAAMANHKLDKVTEDHEQRIGALERKGGSGERPQA